MNNIESKEFFSGERLYLGKSDIDPIGMTEHMDRYKLAQRLITSGMEVLDAACGTGYGTEMLASVGANVYGVEISEHALAWAKEHQRAKNIKFIQGDLNIPLPFDDSMFDVIVSFETLEHVGNQENMLSEFKRVLKKGGILILSSPDREVITEKAHAVNEFHINELSKSEFLQKLTSRFELRELYGQTRYVPLSWGKKMVKRVAKLDIFKIRRKIVGALGLKYKIHKALAPFANPAIESVTPSEPNDFFVLIAVCEKK